MLARMEAVAESPESLPNHHLDSRISFEEDPILFAPHRRRDRDLEQDALGAFHDERSARARSQNAAGWQGCGWPMVTSCWVTIGSVCSLTFSAFHPSADPSRAADSASPTLSHASRRLLLGPIGVKRQSQSYLELERLPAPRHLDGAGGVHPLHPTACGGKNGRQEIQREAGVHSRPHEPHAGRAGCSSSREASSGWRR
jgi:hypothetical protein